MEQGREQKRGVREGEEEGGKGEGKDERGRRGERVMGGRGGDPHTLCIFPMLKVSSFLPR